MFGVAEGKKKKKNPIMKSQSHRQQEEVYPLVVFRVEEQLGPGAKRRTTCYSSVLGFSPVEPGGQEV